MSQVVDAVGALREAFDALADLPLDALSHAELLEVLSEMETLSWQTPSLGHRIIARLQHEASPRELGGRSLKVVLCRRLRISVKDAARRLAEAKDLGPRTALSGEPLEPLRASTAAARAAGSIGPEHVEVIRGFFAALPSWVDVETVQIAEQNLVATATGCGPRELAKTADLLASYIDQDGREPDDAERARKRSVRLGKQQSDGMSQFGGSVDAEFLATWEPLLAKFSAPGMCNPADEFPCTSGTPSQAQIDGDDRSHGQRVHDAMIAIGRIALCSGELGRLNGLPVTVIVTTTLQDLQRGAGVAMTGGGSLVPMSDLIRMASHAHHYLSVFDGHTAEPLYLARTKRLASPGQRIMLHARDRGCTFPGCTVSGYGSQVHHVNGWVAKNGQTNVDEMTLACGGDNRMAEDGWEVTIAGGVVSWAAPPPLETGQTRVNFYHHPERLLIPPEPEPDG